MKRALLALCAVLAIASVAACGGDDAAESSPSATVGTVSTTSTTLSVEAEVEAAYLRSWDVFAKAALELDPAGLDALYAGPALQVVVDEVNELKAAGTPVRYEVEHDYEIEVAPDRDLAEVRDSYVNHSVLLDPETGEPSEPDPNKVLHEVYLMQLVEGQWKVVDISRA